MWQFATRGRCSALKRGARRRGAGNGGALVVTVTPQRRARGPAGLPVGGVSLAWAYAQGTRRIIPRLPEDQTKPLDRSPGARRCLGLTLSRGQPGTPRLPEALTPPHGSCAEHLSLGRARGDARPRPWRREIQQLSPGHMGTFVRSSVPLPSLLGPDTPLCLKGRQLFLDGHPCEY